jgi:hypothetical protein
MGGSISCIGSSSSSSSNSLIDESLDTHAAAYNLVSAAHVGVSVLVICGSYPHSSTHLAFLQLAR